MRPNEIELRAAASVLAGRALLARAVEALAPHGIVPAVLKGILVSALREGSGEPPRPMLDVDVLIAPSDRVQAEVALTDAGLERIGRTRTATTFRDHELRIDLDLHAHLVQPGLFLLESEQILARATRDRTLFGIEVRVLHPHDSYAHLIAHFAHERSNARDRRRLSDLQSLARAYELTAAPLARHLVSSGVGRAARYVLTLAARSGDSFAAEVRDQLPWDVVGDTVARGTEAWLARFSGTSWWAVPAPHALNHTLSAGARSLAVHVGRGAWSRARRVLERAPECG